MTSFTLFKDGKIKGQSRMNQKDTLLEAVCEKRWGFEAKWMFRGQISTRELNEIKRRD